MSPSRVIVTGDRGFVGKHLRSLLHEQGSNVEGLSEHGIDLRDYESLRTFINRVRPTHIYHLAAQAFVPESFANPKRVFEINTIGSLNLLEAVRQTGTQANILLAGTSEEYGDGFTLEESKLQPRSPYAVSKAAMDHLGQLYAKAYDMHIVVTRAFNHTGPGRGEMYAESSFAKQIVRIERHEQAELTHGNLEATRNYTDVRDIVRAYSLAIDLPSDVYNICSDRNVQIKEVLDILSSMTLPFRTVDTSSLHRPADFSFKKPNCDKFKRLTDWKAKIPLETTLKDLLEYWRGR